jgi:ATP-dependent RNA helicase DHX57
LFNIYGLRRTFTTRQHIFTIMVNKPHASRNHKPGSKKPQASASTINGEDTSYIVFGNERSKKGKQPVPEPVAKTKANDASATDAQLEAEKKPDTRTLIAGASWTGKLPQTLFNEHCQKQRWERPEYTVHRNPGGFTGAVILRQKHPKTGEITVLPPITPPKDYNKDHGAQPSAVEARHFAAAYALFRVSNMKSIHMMLPPQYRDLWKGDFLDLKSEAVAQGQGYLYEADPFAAKKAADLAKLAKEKARADKAKLSEQDKKDQVVSLDGQVQSKHVLKGWQRVPKVEMGGRTRREEFGIHIKLSSIRMPRSKLWMNYQTPDLGGATSRKQLTFAKIVKSAWSGFSFMFRKMIYLSGRFLRTTPPVSAWLVAISSVRAS